MSMPSTWRASQHAHRWASQVTRGPYPATMPARPASTDLATFVATTAAQAHAATPPLPAYVRRRAWAARGTICPLCGSTYNITTPRSFAHPVLATILPINLGGPMSSANAFVCCRRCQQRRAGSDLLALETPSSDWTEARATVLMSSAQHGFPDNALRQGEIVQAAWAARHALPRHRVYACQENSGIGLLGIPCRFGDRASHALAHLITKMAMAKVVHRDAHVTVYQLTEIAFRQAVWTLIDANALVVDLGHRAEVHDPRDRWWLLFHSPTSWRSSSRPTKEPDRPPSLSARPGAARMRRCRARQRLAREEVVANQALRAAQHRVNDQHKAYGLDGQDQPSNQDAMTLQRLQDAERTWWSVREQRQALGKPLHGIGANCHRTDHALPSRLTTPGRRAD
jgi:hypothetical protein